MLDINLFRVEKGGNPDIIRESQRRRYADEGLVDEVIRLDEKWRQCRFQLDQLKTQFNKLNKQIRDKKIAKEDASELIAESKELDAQIKKQEEDEKDCKLATDKALLPIGNLVHDSVPVDNNEDNNMVVKKWGEERHEDKLHNHVDLVEMLGIADLEKGTGIAGNRGYYLKGAGVLLNQALINFGLAFLVKRGFTPLHTPFFMKQDVMAECAQLAQFDEELYKVSGEGDDKYLIATSEQPLCAYHRGDWMEEKGLPIRYAGYSTCFRKEAGSHGRDTLGIFRVHQFEKVEQFVLTSPNDNASWTMHEELLKNSEEFYQALGLPYRVVAIVSGALNDAAAKKYDLEAWFPASKAYRELVSCSNCTDFQARRLETRFGIKKIGDQKKEYVHLLNSTLTATERTLCCLLETHQTPDGVKVPECLQPMVGLDFIPFVKKTEAEKEKGGGKQKAQGTKNASATKPATPPKSKEQKSVAAPAGGSLDAANGDAKAAANTDAKVSAS